ncbi:ABC transporter substrate-binding protein [Thomasclavelia cocleata]|uniref:ABC transporter substrate-binding protein n=1 Tax=Thomasclavelia cocleata TaxID=69824 RepID=UPI0024309ADF|nr:ABC transporter substrate-binding protein [Thomasclavelia cocleata]
MKVNKLFKLIAASALTLGMMTGCGGKDNEDLKEVAIIQYVEHTSLDTIKKAFDKQMEELGYKQGENINYTFKNAQGDSNIAPSIIQGFQSGKKDCVVAIATPVAMSAAVMAKNTPVVFAAVTDPISAGLTSSLEKPDKNITGTSDEIQVEQILEKALEIDPDLKTLGVIYNKGEVNSVTNIKKAKAFCEKNNISLVEGTITAVNEVQSAIDVLASKSDAIFAPNDNMVASAMDMVSTACSKAKVPLFVGADSMVQDGGFLSVGINYDDLGKETANMVDKILKGEKVKNIPVKVFKEDLSIYVNKKILGELGITLPDSIKNDKAYIEM